MLDFFGAYRVLELAGIARFIFFVVNFECESRALPAIPLL